MANIHPLLPNTGSRIGPGLIVAARFDTLAVADGDYGAAHIAVLNMDGSVRFTIDGAESFAFDIGLSGTFAIVQVRLGQSSVVWPFQQEGVADGTAVALDWRWFDNTDTEKWSIVTAADYFFDPYTGLPLLLSFNNDKLSEILAAVRKTY